MKESLDTIGEALAENGKVIVTGCLGARAGESGGNLVKDVHPSVLPSPAHTPRKRGDGGGTVPTCPNRTTRSSTWCPAPLARRASSSRRATMRT